MLTSLLLLTIAAHAADLTVGTATAKAGQRATGFVEIPAGADAAASVPVIVINGAKPGPKLAVVAGSHGTEYASIVAVQKLGRSVEASELAGALIIVPLMNIAAFSQKVPHLNPVDGKNMNRFFPGKADGSQTERISWAVAKQVVERSDYLIDLHGGDLDENLRQYSYWPQTGNSRLDAISKGMVMAFGLDHVILQKTAAPVPGATSISRFAQEAGKPTIIAEAGHAGTTHAEDVDALVNGCVNVMRHLKMLPGDVQPVTHPVWIGQTTVVRSEHDGVFHPLVAPEAYISKGMRIGYVNNYFGEKIADVTAPVAGIVVYISAVPSMKKGDNAAYIGEIASEP